MVHSNQEYIGRALLLYKSNLGIQKQSITLNYVQELLRETNFLKQGKELGNRAVNGKLMFVYQALEAFKIWHKIEPQVNNEVLQILDHD